MRQPDSRVPGVPPSSWTDPEAFEAVERLMWAGRTDASAAGFDRLCACPAPELPDAARASDGTRVLDVGAGMGTAPLVAQGGALVRAADVDAADGGRAHRRAAAAEVAALPELLFLGGEFDAVAGIFVRNRVTVLACAVRW
ncbi:hypothetical protein [Streptomyces sp. MUSC 125]|uniref:hypothetical protein n=1 Tax=Streptomyces sp. MUSC 125 TaxID=1428624 RepID=UPI000690A3BC|nr:hypothetical protein [Streptomyces sp. MUSC 125]